MTATRVHLVAADLRLVALAEPEHPTVYTLERKHVDAAGGDSWRPATIASGEWERLPAATLEALYRLVAKAPVSAPANPPAAPPAEGIHFRRLTAAQLEAFVDAMLAADEAAAELRRADWRRKLAQYQRGEVDAVANRLAAIYDTLAGLIEIDPDSAEEIAAKIRARKDAASQES